MRRHLPAILLVLCAAILGGTLYLLLQWRFATGDVYPPYSSLRTDPLGTMALYESLERMPGVTVSRDHRMTNRLPPGEGTTYLHLAARRRDWDELPAETFHNLERFLMEGGRLVIMFAPTEGFREEPDKKDNEAKEKKENEKKEPQKKDHIRATPTPEKQFISLADRWGLDLSLRSRKGAAKPSATMARNISGLALPAELAWHSDIFLKNPGPGWKTIYLLDNEVVVAERAFGGGSVVVATDSYIVSNEAMLRDRQPGLLAWLVGSSHHVVFDEAHLGIADSPGIAALARKYRLHGVVAALLILALLFFWKNSSSLARPAKAAARPDTVTGRDAAAGFIALLRRNIPPDRVLDLCLAEWNKTFARGTKYSRREKEAVSAIVAEEQARPAKERDPAAAYRRICAALHHAKAAPKI